jgi:hypothetical protein
MESLNQNAIKHKTGLLNLAAERGNVSKARRKQRGPSALSCIAVNIRQQ